MARYEPNAKVRRSPGNDDEVSIICFPQKLMDGSVRSENEARILYTVEKGFIWQSKRAHFEKNLPPRYARRITFHFLAAFRAAQRSLYTSNLLPTPMQSIKVQRASRDTCLLYSQSIPVHPSAGYYLVLNWIMPSRWRHGN